MPLFPRNFKEFSMNPKNNLSLVEILKHNMTEQPISDLKDTTFPMAKNISPCHCPMENWGINASFR